MMLSARINLAPGRGYRLQLHEAPPPNFTTDFQVELEEFSFYSESEEDDVFLTVSAQQLTTTLHPLEEPGAYEVLFSGQVDLEVPEAQLADFREANRENGLDYALELHAPSTGQRLASDDDWEFLENVNVRLEC